MGIRVATRARPALPLERLRLDGRLVDVGPAEIRLDRDEIAELLARAWGRRPRPAELDFADEVLGGWPAAVQLWQETLGDGDDLLAPLQPGQRLHEYLHEELLPTLPDDVRAELRGDPAWMLGPGPLLKRANSASRRLVGDRMVRDRVGVVPCEDGWCLLPLAAAFIEMHVSADRDRDRTERRRPARDGRSDGPGMTVGAPAVIRTLGGLAVSVDQVRVPDAAWPTASRRLLELLLCLPGYQTTAQQAAQVLWPRHLLRAALNSFNVALHGLRRVLEPELTTGSESSYVIRQGHTYRLCLDRIACDVEEFSQLVRQAPWTVGEAGARQLEAATELYHGDFLATSPEEFAVEKRERLRRLVVDSLERLGEWHSSGGRAGNAIRVHNRLLELLPQREDVWARVLELYLETDDTHHALATLHRCEQTLQAAGTEPSALLQELHRRIRAEDPLRRA
jgi:DNA-binding SARP family transcriptional activator